MPALTFTGDSMFKINLKIANRLNHNFYPGP